MTDAELAAIRAENAERRKRKDAATEGPWTHGSCAGDCWVETAPDAKDFGATRIASMPDDDMASPDVEADAAFIAATRSDPVEDRIDDLLAEVERLKAAILAEREACAILAEKTLADGPDPWDHGDKIAATIRARP